MIVITRSYQITTANTTGTSTYNYSWESSSSCVTISPSAGVSTGIVNAQFSFMDENCIENTSITLNVINQTSGSQLGCTGSFPIIINNVCDSLEISPITEQPNYILSVSASSPGCSSVNFSWRVDTSLFDFSQSFSSSFSSAIQLRFKKIHTELPASTTITVTATDCRGCIKETSYLLTICKPALPTVNANLYCNTSFYTTSPIFVQNPTGCATFVPDWTTLSFINTNNFTIIREPNLTLPNYISISTTDLSVTPGLYSAFYNIRDINGVLSQNGVINIIVNPCSSSPISIPDFTYQIGCDVEDGDFVDIPIDDKIFTLTNTIVDWNTWQLVTPPASASASIVLYTSVQGNHYIRYQVPAVTGSDVFRWSLCDNIGNCAQSSTYTIILDCNTPPLLGNDSTCAVCGESKIISVLNNDLSGGSPFNLLTLTITTQPANGTAIALPNGTVLYQASTNYIGSDLFSYTISNISGSIAVPANVVVDVICAGEGGEVTLCNE